MFFYDLFWCVFAVFIGVRVAAIVMWPRAIDNTLRAFRGKNRAEQAGALLPLLTLSLLAGSPWANTVFSFAGAWAKEIRAAG